MDVQGEYQLQKWIRTTISALLASGQSLRSIVNTLDREVSSLREGLTALGNTAQTIETQVSTVYIFIDRELAIRFQTRPEPAPVEALAEPLEEREVIGAVAGELNRAMNPGPNVHGKQLAIANAYRTLPLEDFITAFLEYINAEHGTGRSELLAQARFYENPAAITKVRNIVRTMILQRQGQIQ